jgi:hypothetical protein
MVARVRHFVQVTSMGSSSEGRGWGYTMPMLMKKTNIFHVRIATRAEGERAGTCIVSLLHFEQR